MLHSNMFCHFLSRITFDYNGFSGISGFIGHLLRQFRSISFSPAFRKQNPADFHAILIISVCWALEQVSGEDAYLPETVKRLLAVMEYDVPYTGAQLMRKLQLKSRENFRKLYLVPALERSLITMSVPDKPTSRNQSYIRK